MTGEATTAPAEEACAEPGRRMFFEYAGRHFAQWPRLAECPRGTLCDQCGSMKMKLWRTAAGAAACLVQLTITRKRSARNSPDEVIVASDAPGCAAFADGHFAIAGPHRSMLVTNLVPNSQIPSSVEMRWTKPGSLSAALYHTLFAPPSPPFVAIAFQKKAGFQVKVTVDQSCIILNGRGACTVERPLLDRLLRSLDNMTWREASELIGLRNRLSGGVAYKHGFERERDQARLIEIRASGIIAPDAFRRLPAPGSPEAGVIRMLLDRATRESQSRQVQTNEVA